ncbi:hypothetical protein FP803_01840 [Candidatus Woesearchaeota archaeon]|nr:hypothetical protein [Candidatus Woesearchaeota archaeon]
MALISNAKGRRKNETPSGYERLFGNRQLGMLMSKVQSAVISTGNELEKVLASKLENTHGISIQKINKENRVFKGIKDGHDIIIDCVIAKEGKFMLIEIKDGDTFDTKKVAGEIASLITTQAHLIEHNNLKENDVTIHYCSFNATSHEQIERGAKGLLPKGSAMTGKEFCKLVGLNFEKIVQERKKDQQENLNYFISELKKIPEIHSKFQ